MWLIVLISVLSVVIDQITKQVIVHQMVIGESISVIDGFLSITSHRNAGAAWGMLQGKMLFFYVVTLVIVGVLLYWIKTLDFKKERLLGIALALILGGAIGNFIDRILYQHVIDFIDVIIFGYDFPIFNIADSSLTIGVILMGIDTIKAMIQEAKEKSTPRIDKN